MKVFRTFAATNLLGAGMLLIPAGLALPTMAQEPTPAPQQNQTAPAEQNQTQMHSDEPATPAGQDAAGQPSYQGQDHDNIQTKSSAGKEPTQTHFTEQQLVTSTVHQAWLLSGKNEANFVEMVEQIADISAHNRGVKLPDSAEAGRKMGEYIKMRARQDTDELLYAIVDKAVLNATTDAPHHAGAKTAHTAKAQHTDASSTPQ